MTQMVNFSEHKIMYTEAHLDINDSVFQGELAEILDDGKIKLVPPTEITNDDKNIETIFKTPDTLLRVISSKTENNSKDSETVEGAVTTSERSDKGS